MELKSPENKVLTDMPSIEDVAPDMLTANHTEEVTLPVHDDSPLPKKEPLEMLAKAGKFLMLLQTLVKTYVQV